MTVLSRRSFVVSAAAASAAFGLDGPLAFIRPAGAQMAGANPPKFARFKVGDTEVTQLYDGIWQKAHDPGFIKNASLEDTKKALRDGNLTDAHVPITFTITVVRSGGRTVMFDSGTGGQMAPSAGLMMRESMQAAGIDPKSISTIVMTHFHPDHIFGLMAIDTNAQVFPDAEIVVPASEYKYWTDPGLIASLPEARQGLAKRIQATFPSWKNVRQVEDGKEAAPGITSVASNGHTPGHTSYLVGSGSGQLMVLGDVANVPALFVRNPGWHASFDQDAAMAEMTRRKMFDRVVADKTTISGYHFGMPGAGSIAKDGSGYAYTPVSG
ncbi:MAG: MBL fold metallo-hydrolase [Hyphomicrobiaceae bacterium]|nr:MBL fold metallo-hydrolase [Hyphomicrobiaceae bacterium]